MTLANIRKSLIQTRENHGADTPIGHICSNIVKLLETRDGATVEHMVNIDANLTVQIAALEILKR